MLLGVLVGLTIAVAIYVRLAPTDAGRWHHAARPAGTEMVTLKGGYIWRKVVSADEGQAAFEALVAAAANGTRTKPVLGSIADRRITFQSRTLVMGFPDHTTIGLYETEDGTPYLEAYGRLRFGRSDLGVNKRRIEGWVADAGL